MHNFSLIENRRVRMKNFFFSSLSYFFKLINFLNESQEYFDYEIKSVINQLYFSTNHLKNYLN